VNHRNSKERFVLIGGMPRSGTTLVETVIGSHSRIAMPPGDFPFAAQANAGWRVKRILSVLSEKPTWEHWKVRDFSTIFDFDYGAAFRQALLLYAQGVGKELPGAKAPYSEFYLDLYEEWLTDHELRFITVIRNPIDVIASLKHSQIHSHLHGFRNLVEVQSRNWVRSVSLVLGKEHDKRTQFCAVRYEDFVSDPESTVSDLCRFIGVDPEIEPMLNRSDFAYYDTNTSFPQSYADRSDTHTYVYQPESRKQSLSRNDISVIGRICGETARSLGYKDPDLLAGPPETMRKISSLSRLRRLPERILRKISR
jgi:hypothetical protein